MLSLKRTGLVIANEFNLLHLNYPGLSIQIGSFLEFVRSAPLHTLPCQGRERSGEDRARLGAGLLVKPVCVAHLLPQLK